MQHYFNLRQIHSHVSCLKRFSMSPNHSTYTLKNLKKKGNTEKMLKIGSLSGTGTN